MGDHDLTYKQQLGEALAFLKQRDDFLVVSHVQPDGDAISSTVVMAWLLQRLGKRFTLVNEGEAPARLSFLALSELVQPVDALPADHLYSNIITVDCADYARVGTVSTRFAPEAALLNIDHHSTNDHFGTVHVVRSDAAATVEILYDLIQYAGEQLDAASATGIYTGLLTDTGGFRYANTSPRVLEIAAALLAAGARGHELADRLLERMSKPQLELLQRGLARLQFTADGKVAWLYIEAGDLDATGATSEDLEGLVNYARNVDGVEVGMLFKETKEGQVKVSLRSAGTADVAALAQCFGGGGHVRAAGCKLQGPLADAVTQVVNKAVEALR